MSATASIASAIITRARHLTGDVLVDLYRHTDTEFLLWLAEGQRDIIKRLPHVYIDGSGDQHTGVAVPDAGAVALVSTAMNVHPNYDNALVAYLCWRAMSSLKSATAEEQALASRYKQDYEEAVSK